MDYANAEKILSVSDLVIKFNLRGRVLTAIRGISMDIYKGESLAIVGESGRGRNRVGRAFSVDCFGICDTQSPRRRRAA